MSSFNEGSGTPSLHDIVSGLTGAKALASIMVERHPETIGPLIGFVEGLNLGQVEFYSESRPRRLDDLPLRVSNEGLLRPRVARAKEII
jgi:hypothetical protein